MKNFKKTIALLLAATVTVSSVAVFAEEAETTETTEDGAVLVATADDAEEKAVDSIEIETVNLGDYISESDKWGSDNNKAITFDNSKISNGNDTTMYVAYTEDNFANKLVQFKQTFNFDGGKAWGGFILNSSSYTSAIWGGGRGYLVVVKESQIELQKYSKEGQRFVSIVKNDYIKDNTPANISAGAVNVNGGVNIFMFVDGKCVFNWFDAAEDAVTEGNFFTIYETSGSQTAAFDGEEIPAVPAALKITGKATAGELFKAEIVNASFGSEATEEYTYEWFYNDEESGKLNEIEEAGKSEFGSKYTPAGVYENSVGTGETHVVAEEEVGGYYIVEVKDSEGNTVLTSAPTVVNNYQYIISDSVVLCIDCEYSYVKGVKSQIDPEDYNVSPTIVDSRTLVPVRFVAESLGAEVGWDNDTKKITIDLDGKQIVMTLNDKNYTVDGEAFELDVPAQVMYERTMVPVRVVSEAFGKSVIWDEENQLIFITDSDITIDPEAETSTFAYIHEKILKRM